MAGHGIGNLWKHFMDKAIQIPEYKVRSSGPYTLIGEYGISDRISAGLAGSYAQIKGESNRFELKDQLTIWTLLLRGNYHFFRSQKLDAYCGAGFGVSNSKYENKDLNNANLNEDVPSNFDYSGQLGLRYFPLPYVGAWVELGYVGGSFAQVGACVKF